MFGPTVTAPHLDSTRRYKTPAGRYLTKKSQNFYLIAVGANSHGNIIKINELGRNPPEKRVAL